MEVPPIRLISESEFGLGRTDPMAKPTARHRPTVHSSSSSSGSIPWTRNRRSHDYSALTLGCGNSIIRMTVVRCLDSCRVRG